MTDAVIEGEAVEVPREVVVRSTPQAHLAVGVGALAAMSDEDFDRNLGAMEKGVARAKRMKAAIMVEDEDFGLIPGTNKPTLLKPGAEKLALAYGLTGRFDHHLTYGHSEDEPPITVVVDCYLHLGGHDGPAIAQGMGMASSFEKRYRWRKGGRVCPDCGKEGVIYTKGRGGQWWHPTDAKPAGGCGANFPKDDARLADQSTADVENPDPFELGNTLLKMAEKRAYVDAVLRATASSGLFSQDMEDMDDHRQASEDRPPASRPAERAALLPTTNGPTEHPLSALAKPRTGVIEKGDGDFSDLQSHVGVNGSRIGFRLRSDEGTIHQVIAEGDIANGLFAASGMDLDKLVKQTATVEGRLSEMREPGRRPLLRLRLDRIAVMDYIIPAADVIAFPEQTPVRSAPADAQTTPPLDTLNPPRPDCAAVDPMTGAKCLMETHKPRLAHKGADPETGELMTWT